MLPDIEIGDSGIRRAIVIDGYVFRNLPQEIEALPEPVSDYQDMLDGGAREWQRRPYFDGVPNHSDRYTFSIPFEWLEGEALQNMEIIRVTGGIHRLTLWRMVPIVFTCKAGVQTYYLPRFRKVAAHLYTDLHLGNGVFVSTDAFPTKATLNGLPLTVTYALGPALDPPAAGGIVFAKYPEIAGAAMDYTPLRLGDAVATGDTLILWGCWSHEVSMRAPRIRMSGMNESHAHTFVEV